MYLMNVWLRCFVLIHMVCFTLYAWTYSVLRLVWHSHSPTCRLTSPSFYLLSNYGNFFQWVVESRLGGLNLPCWNIGNCQPVYILDIILTKSCDKRYCIRVQSGRFWVRVPSGRWHHWSEGLSSYQEIAWKRTPHPMAWGGSQFQSKSQQLPSKSSLQPLKTNINHYILTAAVIQLFRSPKDKYLIAHLYRYRGRISCIGCR